MRNGTLFEITKEILDTGLRGVPVGYCTTSFVDPYQGLSYAGYPIAELSRRDPLEVIYLLYYGEVGSKAQVDHLRKELCKRAYCKDETIRAISQLPRKGAPMDVFAAAILVAGMFEGTDDYREDCLNLIAKLPQIAACTINSHAGWSTAPDPKPELGYMESFVHMLQMPREKSKELISVMKLFNVIHYDHSGGNLSTFVGKAVASGLEPMYGSIAAAMTALAGSRHGKANQDSLAFVESVLNDLGENATAEEVELLVRDRLANRELVHGFGHAVLRVEDPRASVCYEYCSKHFPDHPLVKIAMQLRSEGPKVLQENPKISNPYPNIDAITGPMLMAAGFPYPQYYTVLFGLARCVGISMQIVYERLEAREGKGTPIMRPLYLYKPRK